MTNTLIRRATEADIPAIVGLIEDLAEYEHARDECLITEEQLHQALFGSHPALSPTSPRAAAWSAVPRSGS